ncbi:hypothetical protein K490DRAFT_65015 [Saccharata proteae CBS 121410]|uniref:Uncharacterized protein n=1 Tax=Saccharata proteae CBS 121410 TaxID=1314787 RepID=A0A9P4HYD7_9PEZI|nr:hypothetical protein K490DRAFT_65015 [Saccharata proteae CBS 121410]
MTSPSEIAASADTADSQFPVYEARVKDFITKLFKLPAQHFGLPALEVMYRESEEYWVMIMVEMTIPKLKEVLNGDAPPTWTQLYALPSAKEVNDLGTYAILIVGPSRAQNALYNGSATSLKGPMKTRISQHLSTEYRKRALQKNNSRLYELLETNGRHYHPIPVVTGIHPGLENDDPEADAEDQERENVATMRVACLMHEEMMQSFLRSYRPNYKGSTIDQLLKLGPWDGVEWQPTNSGIPLKESLHIRYEFRLPVPTELKMKNAATTARKLWHSQKGTKARERHLYMRLTYKHQIGNQVARMRERRAQPHQIIRWRRLANEARRKWSMIPEDIRPAPNIPSIDGYCNFTGELDRQRYIEAMEKERVKKQARREREWERVCEREAEAAAEKELWMNFARIERYMKTLE